MVWRVWKSRHFWVEHSPSKVTHVNDLKS
jgi:hypothetical protein